MKWLLALLPLLAVGQDFTQKGTLEFRGYFYPQDAQNDSGNAVGEALFRYEFSRSLLRGLRLYGTTETRMDTHHQVERRFFVNWSDRTPQRPAFSIKRLSFLYNRGKFTAEAGKQTIRWGKADILNPTDRFAPRDFLAVVDNEVLGVTAARIIYEGASDSLEVVAQPRFTPSRTPLLNQRWTVLPPQLQNIPIDDLGARIPGGTSLGVRWNHLGRGYEMSLSFYDGHNHLPLVDGTLSPMPVSIQIQRSYPQLRLYGGDVAVPFRWFTLKGEAGYYTSSNQQADEYVIYVVQVERDIGELSFVGGYSGEAVTQRRNPFGFNPDRGLARSFLGRVSYDIGPTRSLSTEYAVRQNGDGTWLRFEYTQTIGQHWRAIAGFTLIRGEPDDFLGQYRLNSHGSLILRYSF